jgi:hypothetical protein
MNPATSRINKQPSQSVMLDPGGKRLLYTQKCVNEVLSLPWVPPVDYVSQFIGKAVKTRRNTYEYTVVCYAAKQQEEPGQRRGEVEVIANDHRPR